MNIRSIALTAAIGSLVLVLSACGGAGDKTTAAAPKVTEAPMVKSETPVATEATQAPTPAPAPAQSAPGDFTAPGTHLSIGETALIKWQRYEKDGFDFSLGVTITGVREGALSDFDAIIDADTKAKIQGYTPYYIDASIVKADLSQAELAFSDVSFQLKAVNADGAALPQFTLLGSWDLCDSNSFEKAADTGTPTPTCVVYMVPGGQAFGAVQWQQYDTDYDMYDGQPVFWDVK